MSRCLITHRYNSNIYYVLHMGHAVAQLVQALRRKVAGSIPDGVIGIFYWHNPSGRTMALGMTQPLTEMSTRNISWRVKAAGAYNWQLYYLRVLIVLKFGSLSLLEHSGTVQACNGIALLLQMSYAEKAKFRWHLGNKLCIVQYDVKKMHVIYIFIFN